MVTLIGIRLGSTYGVLSGQFLCFNSKYVIHFSSLSDSAVHLRIAINQNFLVDFFGQNISNITAIVGKNGVGKSTLLRYIKDLFIKEKNELKFREDDILIFEENGKLRVFINENRKADLEVTNETGQPIEEKFYRNYPKIFDQVKNLSTVFYSNTLELEQVEIETTNYFNISTSYLLENIGKINSKLRNKRIRTQNAHSRFRFTELKRQLSFFRSIDNSTLLMDIPFRRINDLELEIREVSLYDYKKIVTGLEKELFLSPEARKENPRMVPDTFQPYFDWFSETTDEIRNEGLTHKKNVQSSDPRDYIRILIIENLLFILLATLTDGVYDILNQPKRHGASFLNLLRRVFDREIKLFTSIDRVVSDLRPALEDLKASFESGTLHKQIDKKLDRLQELSEFESFILPLIDAGRVSKNSVLFETRDPLTEEMLNQYFSSSMDFKFVKFNWPKLSAGEESLVAFFSRLHTIASESKADNLLLLIDEGDLYFHPEWQRKYMYFLLGYLASSYIDFRKIQLILTTHSPFIVSDLPESNIIFLDRREDQVAVINPEESNLKTFGGNLHTLYSRAFFLGASTISEFALNKIKHNIIDEIEQLPGEVDIDLLKRLINEIGEPVLRGALMDRLNKKISDSNNSRP